jgi:hypothetical protein
MKIVGINEMPNQLFLSKEDVDALLDIDKAESDNLTAAELANLLDNIEGQSLPRGVSVLINLAAEELKRLHVTEKKGKKNKKTKKLKKDIEQHILECRRITNDIGTLLDGFHDGLTYGLTVDELTNTLYGIKTMYDLKFQKLWTVFVDNALEQSKHQ